MVEDYCDRIGLDDEGQREDMHHHLAAMDSAYTEHVRNKGI